jgi:hypothetical protein
VNGDGVVALVDDLMDRSKLAAAVPQCEFVRAAAECGAADIVVVDLARHAGAVAAVRATAPAARLVVFGPHVDEHLLAGARADGADVVLPRSRFFRNPAAAVTGES